MPEPLHAGGIGSTHLPLPTPRRRRAAVGRLSATLLAVAAALTGAGAFGAHEPSRTPVLALGLEPDERETGAIALYSGKPPRRLGVRPVPRGAEAGESHPAVSPTGRQVLTQVTDSRGQERLALRTLDTGQAQDLGPGAAPQWARDGNAVLFARRRGSDSRIAEFALGESAAAVRDLGPGHLARWAPGERELAVAIQVGSPGKEAWELRIQSVHPAAIRRRIPLPAACGSPVALDWSPDHRRLLLTAGKGPAARLWLVDIPLGVVQPVSLDSGDRVRTGCWSIPDDEIFLVVEPPTGGRPAVVRTRGAQTPTTVLQLPSGTTASTIAVYEPVLSPVVRSAAVEPDPIRPGLADCDPLSIRTPVGRLLPPPRRVLPAGRQFVPLDQSPRNVTLGLPSDGHFDAQVQVGPTASRRRQGVGITLFLADGGIVRAGLVDNGRGWATLQGRPRLGRMKLIEAKPLAPEVLSFERGFTFSVRRRHRSLALAVDEREWLGADIVVGAVERVALTMENFDQGTAVIPIRAALYREYRPRSAPLY